MLLLLLCAPLPATAAVPDLNPALGPQFAEPALQAPEQAGNLLQNPGFEEGFYYWNGMKELHLGNGWVPWWIENAEHSPTYLRPEYRQAIAAEFPNRVRSGDSAQEWFKPDSSFYAGIYQQVSGVTAGAPYRFSLWARLWSSAEDDPPDVSVGPANPHLQIGIDPRGNIDPFSVDIIWSPEAAMPAVIEGWSQLAVEADAKSSTVTVFVRTRLEFANKHNNIYLDDAILESAGSTPTVTATIAGGEALPGETVGTATVPPVTLEPMVTATIAGGEATVGEAPTIEVAAIEATPAEATATEVAVTEVVPITDEPSVLATAEPTTETPPLSGAATLTSSPPVSTEVMAPVVTEPVAATGPSPLPVTESALVPAASPLSTAPQEQAETSTPQGSAIAVVVTSPAPDVAADVSAAEAEEVVPAVNPICATPLLGIALLVPVLILMRRRGSHSPRMR